VGGSHIDEDIQACPALPDFKAFFDQVLKQKGTLTQYIINARGA